MLTVTNDRALKALNNLLAIPQRFPQMAQTVRGETLGMAIVAAQANIYHTVPGAYQRTQDYLRSLDAQAQSTQQGVTVRVWSSSDYAAYIEYGRQGAQPQQLVTAALGRNINTPLTLGRSGRAWWIAGPVLTSAQVYAARRLHQLLLEAIKRI